MSKKRIRASDSNECPVPFLSAFQGPMGLRGPVGPPGMPGKEVEVLLYL